MIIYDALYRKQTKSGLLLLVDFEKAFDTVSWSLLNMY